VIILTRVIDGVMRPGQKIRLMATGRDYQVEQLGVFSPKPVPVQELGVGEAGFMVANIKNIADARIGDTITEGLLHMEIVQERLEREFDQDLITTAPGVLYRVTTTGGEVQEIDSPAKLPETGRIAKFE
jgi:translation elongation factor EF-4